MGSDRAKPQIAKAPFVQHIQKVAVNFVDNLGIRVIMTTLSGKISNVLWVLPKYARQEKEIEMSKLIKAAKGLKTKKIFAAAIALVLILVVFTSTVFAQGPQEYEVRLADSGEVVTVKTASSQASVEDLLKLANVELDSNDYTIPAVSQTVEAGTTVDVNRVDYKEVTVTEKVKYSTETKKDKKLAKTQQKVVTKGKNGKKKVTYSVMYINGVATYKEAVSEVVTKEPVTKVVKVGTKKIKGATDYKENGVKSKGGYKVGQVISGRYTHYCACARCNGNSRGITSSGKKIKNGMSNPYYVACNWLPLGTIINVDGTYYTVVDRGGSGLSRKGRIDIFTPEGHSACYRYGTGKCTIEIVRLGW